MLSMSPIAYPGRFHLILIMQISIASLLLSEKASIAQLLGSFRLTSPKHNHLSVRKSSNQQSPNFEERYFAYFRNNNLGQSVNFRGR
ncbi:hypothetical protein T01_241 [Trichinella spiralis]|uniref:Uncharacterized protein n=1 Tax=Trichinella spiralis TaxID=6334 RepID=A0A0V1BF21_TRISP|nr:hypothetical protein T01_241 [Trichinella spiralis]